MVWRHGCNREGDVLAGDRRAVVEARTFDKVEGVAQGIRGDRPAFREVGLRLIVGVELDETSKDLCAGYAGATPGLDGGVQVSEAGLRHPQSPTGLLGLSRDSGGQQREKKPEDGIPQRRAPGHIFSHVRDPLTAPLADLMAADGVKACYDHLSLEEYDSQL